MMLLFVACGSGGGVARDAASLDGAEPADAGVEPADADVDAAPDVLPTSCGFDYDDVFSYSLAGAPLAPAAPLARPAGLRLPGAIAHAEPAPTGYRRVARAGARQRDLGDIVVPVYDDTMPLFSRGAAWTEARRCYETPAGVQLLSEPEAYDLYRAIAELTTGVPLDPTPGVRSVVGLRGSYPGRFAFHGNLPDRFNDTLVLLWVDAAGPHVREFAVNTDTGARDFGVDASSSLRPNRRYHYVNGWHRGYNALQIIESGYLVCDDTNHNGHCDSDRNGWLPPAGALDHERGGSAHNIHMGSLEPPLGTAVVDGWSAGCQVIPGMASWLEFIANAWTELGDPVSYYLVDVRDLDHLVWAPCEPDGTHACPLRVDALPFTTTGDTSGATAREFDVYNCSAADESGPEVVYLVTLDHGGTLTARVDDVTGDEIDVDVHLLDADDPRACLARGDVSLSRAVGPGRYLVVVDTYVVGGVEKAGPYRLDISLQ